ncbi:MAG: alpha/beta hydrolase [Rhodobiaceae bacterium]|nr:alpha/beta hydrolase [Rhodobiaceae bacterium]MCC0055300.1 alpha/beta hydrolase [Rhodobiaceae bacterium]
MNDDISEHELRVGADGRSIAALEREGAFPAVLWLGGFNSSMTGTKASALDRFCAENGRAYWRFDYSANGRSPGDMAEATVSRWLEEARAVAALAGENPVLVGSSMGGWISLRLAEEMVTAGHRVKALVLIAPAVDMTERLLKPALTPEMRRQLEARGVCERPSAYDDGPYRVGQALLDDGANHLILGRDIRLGCPIHIIHGARDPDVPLTLSQELTASLALDDVSMTVIADGDHRLSRPTDIDLICRTVKRYW